MSEEKEIYYPAFILRSDYRKEVFFEVSKKPGITQKDLLDITSPKYRSHLSRTIKELLDQNLISCKNPNDRTYKMYELSPRGLQVKEELSNVYHKN